MILVSTTLRIICLQQNISIIETPNLLKLKRENSIHWFHFDDYNSEDKKDITNIKLKKLFTF